MCIYASWGNVKYNPCKKSAGGGRALRCAPCAGRDALRRAALRAQGRATAGARSGRGARAGGPGRRGAARLGSAPLPFASFPSLPFLLASPLLPSPPPALAGTDDSAQARTAAGLLLLTPPSPRFPLRKLEIGANWQRLLSASLPAPPHRRLRSLRLCFFFSFFFFLIAVIALSASKRYFAWKKEKGKSWERMAVVPSLGSSFIPR